MTPTGALLARIAAALAVVALVSTSVSETAAAASSAQPQGNFGSATVTAETLAAADPTDPFGTPIAISQSLSPGGGVPVVYLVSGATADNLAAGPVAARNGGIILYTDGSSLPAEVGAELTRLHPARVEVVGGTSAIADTVLSAVAALLPPPTVVERVAGSDAYGTAVAFSAASFQPNTGATYHAIPPGRVLDSRIGLGAGLFRSRTKQSFAVAGLAGVPSGAVAVTGNVTVVGQTTAGFVTVAPYLADGVAPSTSTINFPVGDVRANGLTVSLGAGGRLDAMYSAGDTSSTVNVIFDVTGYFDNGTTGASFHAIPPGRVLDSRISLGADRFHSGTKQSFAVAGLVGVPSEAVAVTGNVTIVGQDRAGYVTVAPSLTSGVYPSTSTINFPVGDVRANGITVSLGAGGKLDAMYSAGDPGSAVDIVFDVTGYFAVDPTAANFHAIAPGRVLDSRISLGAGRFQSGTKQSFAVAGRAGVPSDAVAVTGNVTIVGQTAGAFVTVAPSLVSGVAPSTSTINFPKDDVRANGVTVSLGAGGKLDAIYSTGDANGGIDIIFDVTGYFVHDPGGKTNHTSATVVIAATGSFPNAVLAGVVAAKLGVPFLLVDKEYVPASAANELLRLKPNHAIVVGDVGSVSDGGLAVVSLYVPSVERLSGADIYATASIVAARYFPGATTIISTNPLTNPGGSATVPLSIARAAPILYVQDADLLPVTTRDTLISLRPSGVVFVGSIPPVNEAELVGFSDGRLTRPTDTTAYPSYDPAWHDPGELYTVIKAEEIAYPTLVHIFSIGKSYQGRDIWAAKVSSDVSLDEGKPEMMIDALHHADEHLGVEQALYLLETLVSGYATDPLVTGLVNERVTWIVFAVNPDGWEYDLSGGAYHYWRKNRQPASGSTAIGVDINRNYGYMWNCCGGSSSSPWAWNYAGTSPFSTPEAQAIRNFVNSRVVGGVERIKTHISLHANGQLILYPYCYTYASLPGDMTADDHAVFAAMAQTMASTNGYRYGQSSTTLYVTDGDEIDWLYHEHEIFSFTVELYPGEPNPPSAEYYPPYSIVAAQTARNRAMLLYTINMAACPYAAIGKTQQYCAGAPKIL
jgi:putative cell wall-binding protein